jgi:hypothetical protein
MKGNQHIPKQVPLPEDDTRSVRKFYSGMHLPLVVAGMDTSWSAAFYGGGGDHGGPITKKIELPNAWETLLKNYRDFEPSP